MHQQGHVSSRPAELRFCEQLSSVNKRADKMRVSLVVTLCLQCWLDLLCAVFERLNEACWGSCSGCDHSLSLHRGW